MLRRIALIVLACVALAGAKNYTVNLTDTCRAGDAQLQPGQYTLKLDGAKVLLIDKTGRAIEVSAKVETAERKFDYTAVTISRTEGSARINSIALGGSRNRVVFE